MRDAEGIAQATYAYDGDVRIGVQTVSGTLAAGAYGYNVRDWVSRISYPGKLPLIKHATPWATSACGRDEWA